MLDLMNYDIYLSKVPECHGKKPITIRMSNMCCFRYAYLSESNQVSPQGEIRKRHDVRSREQYECLVEYLHGSELT
jgi:hypothetical protein